jgi:site-specific recombinase XerC
MTKTQSLAVVDGIGVIFLQDLNAASIERFLAEMRKSGRSARTSNSYLRSIKSFSRWMSCNRRIPEDVLAILSAVNEKTDPRHERRALNLEDLNRLIAAAEVGQVVASLTGLERSHLYRTAGMTGLRASELASLDPTSFNFQSMELTVKAKSSKHREEDVLPIYEELAAIVQPWLAKKAQETPIWAGPWASSKTRPLR